MKRLLILVSILFLVSGCSMLRVLTSPIEKTPLSLVELDPLELNNVEFVVVTRDNAMQILDAFEKQGKKPVIIGMSGKDYKILAIDIDKIKNYIELQKEIIRKYKEYYEGK